jgi:hypothetical protein
MWYTGQMRIPPKQFEAMFDHAGVDKDKLFIALRTMGKKHLKNKTFKDMWSEDFPTTNYCYVIAEFLWFYKAPKGSKPYSVRVPGDAGLHRFIKWPDGTIVDLAVDQFPDYSLVDYTQAKIRYFLQTGCAGPSKRAKMLAELMGYDPNKFQMNK